MTAQRIKELRHLCAAAKWDSVSDPMIFCGDGVVMVFLPDATVATESGAPVKAFLEAARAGMVELLDAYEAAREELDFGGYRPGPGDLS